jgi:hypothetical protein
MTEPQYGQTQWPELYPESQKYAVVPLASVGDSGAATTRKRSLLTVVIIMVIGLVATTAMWLTTASDLASSQRTVASLQAAADVREASDADVPNLKQVADKYFTDASMVYGGADSVSITIQDGDIELVIVALPPMLTDLGFSSAVIDRMNTTRALDGTLSADGKNCNVTWTYHPDHGLQMVFEADPPS